MLVSCSAGYGSARPSLCLKPTFCPAIRNYKKSSIMSPSPTKAVSSVSVRSKTEVNSIPKRTPLKTLPSSRKKPKHQKWKKFPIEEAVEATAPLGLDPSDKKFISNRLNGRSYSDVVGRKSKSNNIEGTNRPRRKSLLAEDLPNHASTSKDAPPSSIVVPEQAEVSPPVAQKQEIDINNISYQMDYLAQNVKKMKDQSYNLNIPLWNFTSVDEGPEVFPRFSQDFVDERYLWLEDLAKLTFKLSQGN